MSSSDAIDVSPCCLNPGFNWRGTPKGTFTTLASNQAYIAGDPSSEVAVMIVHDLLGWTWPNVRLLADHYASEIGCAVYLPDFFGGEVLLSDKLMDPSLWPSIGVPQFLAKNGKEQRRGEILACARALRERHRKVGAIGFCFGGWAVFNVGAASEKMPDGRPLVDAISTGHPTWLTEAEIDGVGVPVQLLAPEHDGQFTPELKAYASRVIATKGVDFEYVHFPGVEHAFCTRGSEDLPGEREALVRAKNRAVSWFREQLIEKK